VALLFLDFYTLSGFFPSEDFIGLFPCFRRPLAGFLQLIELVQLLHADYGSVFGGPTAAHKRFFLLCRITNSPSLRLQHFYLGDFFSM